MKKTELILAALCACAFLLVVVSVQAAPDANVAGTWTIVFTPPAGGGASDTPMPPTTAVFKQDGNKLSGTLTARGGGEIQFLGTVSGNDVSWSYKTVTASGNEITRTYRATVTGDSMKGTLTTSMRGRGPIDFTAERKK